MSAAPKRQSSKRMQQHIGERGKIKTQLIGTHQRRAGTVGKQTQLLFLDSVFRIAPGTVQLLVEVLDAARHGARQIGHHKARIVALGQHLGFGDHLPGTGPRTAGAVVKLDKSARRLPAVPAATPGFRQRLADAPLQAAIPGQAEKIINPVLLTPPHQVLATKPRIGTQHYTGVRPGLANLRHNARQLLIGAGTGIDPRRPQPGTQQVPVTEDIQRQVAVPVIVAVIKNPLLMTMRQIIGGVQVQPDLLGRFVMGFQEYLHQCVFYLIGTAILLIGTIGHFQPRR